METQGGALGKAEATQRPRESILGGSSQHPEKGAQWIGKSYTLLRVGRPSKSCREALGAGILGGIEPTFPRGGSLPGQSEETMACLHPQVDSAIYLFILVSGRKFVDHAHARCLQRSEEGIRSLRPGVRMSVSRSVGAGS